MNNKIKLQRKTIVKSANKQKRGDNNKNRYFGKEISASQAVFSAQKKKKNF